MTVGEVVGVTGHRTVTIKLGNGEQIEARCAQHVSVSWLNAALVAVGPVPVGLVQVSPDTPPFVCAVFDGPEFAEVIADLEILSRNITLRAQGLLQVSATDSIHLRVERSTLKLTHDEVELRGKDVTSRAPDEPHQGWNHPAELSMPIFTNLTPFEVDEFVGYDRDGWEFYTLIVKASYLWDSQGRMECAPTMRPVLPADVYSGDPVISGPLLSSDHVPVKPRLDVLLAGRLVAPAPVDQVDVTLKVGTRLRKTVRVFGERAWLPGVFSKLALTSLKPFTEMPFQWERSFGGIDPEHPEHFEPRNPCGRGFRKKASGLEKQLAANFEDPTRPIRNWDDRPLPVGFGPVAPHWQPRSKLAGTYDEKWQQEQFPLLPKDFDTHFYNSAPLDQQLDGYVPGEEVVLHQMTAVGLERFSLPDFKVPVLIRLPRGQLYADAVRPDTLIIEPAERCLTVVGRLLFHPKPDMFAIRAVLVGELSPARRRAIETGKRYLDLRRLTEEQG